MAKTPSKVLRTIRPSVPPWNTTPYMVWSWKVQSSTEVPHDTMPYTFSKVQLRTGEAMIPSSKYSPVSPPRNEVFSTTASAVPT